MADSNPNLPIENLCIGKIVEVDGTHIIAELDSKISELTRVFGGVIYPIGQFGSIVKVHFGRCLIYGYVGRLRMMADYDQDAGSTSTSVDARIIEADLFGEGEWILNTDTTPPIWQLRFSRGVSTFPLPQQKVYLTPRAELAFIYGHGKGPVIKIGEHVGSGGTPCYADINELLGKHTAILGSTGAGKSGAAATLLHGLLGHGADAGYDNWKPRIVLLDPHNEYGTAFPGHRRLSTDEGTLVLPYWLLNLQEVLSLVIGKTEFVATSQANVVKVALQNARLQAAASLGLDPGRLSVDSPVPFSIGIFKEEVNKQRPPGKDKKEQEPFNSVINKLEVLEHDPRMKFLMNPWDGTTDLLPMVLGQLVLQRDFVGGSET